MRHSSCASPSSSRPLITFAASAARFEQQQTSNRANNERITQYQRSRQWTEAEIHTLMFPSSPSSSSTAPACKASSSSSNRWVQVVATSALVCPIPVGDSRDFTGNTAARQAYAFCDHLEVLLPSQVLDPQTFALLTDPQYIMAISLRFMTSKVMVRVREVFTVIEALLEYLRQVGPVQVHHDRPDKHRPAAQDLLRSSYFGHSGLWRHARGP